jgi:hypothetical protein
MRQSCTYLTTYSGNKLPPFYIGSSYLHKVKHNNYRGSVRSREFRHIWENEILENPHLFRTHIISIHGDREAATQKEYLLQKCVKAPSNSMYINMAYATKNGYFTMSRESQWKGKRGEECPWFGVKRSPENYRSSRIGSKNPAAKHYKVFNSNHELILECTANLKQHCLDNGIPLNIAIKLTNSNDKPLHPSKSKSNNKSKLESCYPEYIGWYTTRTK